MSAPLYNISGQGLGSIATFVNETATGRGGDVNVEKEGALATTLRPIGGSKEINVIKDYKWTLSNRSEWSQWEEIPYVRLREYKCVDSSIKKQLRFNTQLGLDTARNSAVGFISKKGIQSIDVYDEIWPKDNPTNFSYVFPYFNKKGMELATEAWQSLDGIGDSFKAGAEGVQKLAAKDSRLAEWAKNAGTAIDLLQTGSNLSMNIAYPTVGVSDRPKMFSSHSNRSIEISFTLYNTVDERDWRENRDLLYLIMSQNLFNKRDLTTGVPPVFYDVYIPGQYYSYASTVSNYQVGYLGNQRLLLGGYVVPDAYEVTITLSELLQPSKNQFEALQDGSAEYHVKVMSDQQREQQNRSERSKLNSQIKR